MRKPNLPGGPDVDRAVRPPTHDEPSVRPADLEEWAGAGRCGSLPPLTPAAPARPRHPAGKQVGERVVLSLVRPLQQTVQQDDSGPSDQLNPGVPTRPPLLQPLGVRIPGHMRRSLGVPEHGRQFRILQRVLRTRDGLQVRLQAPQVPGCPRSRQRLVGIAEGKAHSNRLASPPRIQGVLHSFPNEPIWQVGCGREELSLDRILVDLGRRHPREAPRRRIGDHPSPAGRARTRLPVPLTASDAGSSMIQARSRLRVMWCGTAENVAPVAREATLGECSDPGPPTS